MGAFASLSLPVTVSPAPPKPPCQLRGQIGAWMQEARRLGDSGQILRLVDTMVASLQEAEAWTTALESTGNAAGDALGNAGTTDLSAVSCGREDTVAAAREFQDAVMIVLGEVAQKMSTRFSKTPLE